MTRDQGITVSLASVCGLVTSLVAVWAFAAPIAQKALAGEIEKQLRPIQEANIITISSTVKNLQNAIVALEFKRDTCTPKPDCWTVRDAQDLTAARSDLVAAENSLKALRK